MSQKSDSEFSTRVLVTTFQKKAVWPPEAVLMGKVVYSALCCCCFFLSLPEKHDPNYTEWRLLIELLESGAPSNVLQIHSGIKVRISREKKKRS